MDRTKIFVIYVIFILFRSSTERNEDSAVFCTSDPLDSHRAVFPSSSFECFETSQVVVESGNDKSPLNASVAMNNIVIL